ncbi:AraC family transcriptional regulator [Massilia sp. PWRC2]|uniref:AraC family transcriptional regulator n=1 Tax=Massilia sp. PWRC2 TaxID=2804626 RepID=UPI003CF8B196
MIDPLADVVTLLQPAARFSKHIVGAGQWHSRRSDAGQPFYCVVLEGSCRLTLDGHAPSVLQEGDFALIPAAFGVTMSSVMPNVMPNTKAPAHASNAVPVALGDGVFRIGEQAGPTDLRILAGHCSFGSPNAALLVSLLPALVHVRGEPRLAMLVKLLNDESRQQRPAREIVLAHLLQVLLIEALRSSAGTAAPAGLVRGLADPRLAAAIRAMHEAPARAWTVVELANAAALSRSTFFGRFKRLVGMAPMAYLLAWRMALAQDMLRRGEGSVAAIAERVGYGSASTFSVAFSRHVGRTPTQCANAPLASTA